MTAGVMLGSRINGAMHTIWRTILWRRAMPTGSAPTGFVYRLRTHAVYRGMHRVIKRHVVPLASAVVLLYLGASLVSHVAFDVADAAGAFCREGTRSPLVTLEPVPGRTVTVQGFAASSICWPTGIELVEGRRYRITITQARDWRDRFNAVDLSGFEIGELPDVGTRVRLFAGLPLRRVLNRPWFRPIARIGAVGADEYPLDPDTRPVAARVPPAADAADELVADIKARRTGELFLYVNDAIVGLPRVAGAFYANNGGQAQVEVVRLGRR
jgi:hypothetical protein